MASSVAGPARGARAALAAAALLLAGGAPAADQPPPAAGMLLIARPHLNDPNFTRTVVLLVRHDDQGALGLVLNRRSSTRLSAAAPKLAATLGPAAELGYGGPVAPGLLHVLVRAPAVPEGSFQVFDDVHLCGAPAAVERIVAEGGAWRRVRVFAGYSGWAAGQLESEIERGDWVVRRATSDAVFRGGEGLWRELAPADPARTARLRREAPDARPRPDAG